VPAPLRGDIEANYEYFESGPGYPNKPRKRRKPGAS
jgi:hypothetical protein